MTKEEYNKLQENDTVIINGKIGIVKDRHIPWQIQQKWKIQTLDDNAFVIPLSIETFCNNAILVNGENADVDKRKL